MTVSKGRSARALTMADIALAAGVSPMTVSRVVNRQDGVSQRLRTQVQSVIEELSYQPNEAARALVGSAPPQIALLFRNPHASHFTDFLTSSVEAAGHGLASIVIRKCPTGNDAALAIRELAGRVEGFLLAPPLGEAHDVHAMLRETRSPAVALATALVSPSISTIGVNDYAAALSMTRHLLSLGHRRIGFIGGASTQLASARRKGGYEAALREAGLETDGQLIVEGEFSFRSGLDGAEHLFDLDSRPTAIFASNDEMAAAAVTTALSRGYKVPADVTVCGFDDTALANMIWPALTTIRQPLGEMAERAVSHLVDMIRQRRKEGLIRYERIELPFELVRRQSDAVPRTRPSVIPGAVRGAPLTR